MPRGAWTYNAAIWGGQGLMDPRLPPPCPEHITQSGTRWGGRAYNTTLFSAAEDTNVLVAACCATSREQTRDGAGEGQCLCGGRGLICPRTLSYVHCELVRGIGRVRSTDLSNVAEDI